MWAAPVIFVVFAVSDMARRTKEDALATRAALLDAAERVFQLRGVSRTSLADIADPAALAASYERGGASVERGPFDAAGRYRDDACNGGVLDVPLERGCAQSHAVGRRGRFGDGREGCGEPHAEHAARDLCRVPRAGQGRRREEGPRRRRVQLQLRRI